MHHHGVLQIIFVEGDASAPDGAGEVALQQADVVLVDVDVGEHIVEDGAQHVARVKKLLDTCRVHALDDCLLTLGVFAVDSTAGGLLDGYRQDELAREGRFLYLVLEEGELLVDTFFHLLGRDVVE